MYAHIWQQKEKSKKSIFYKKDTPASVTLTVNKASHSVTLPEGFTGSATVTDGDAYTFSVSEDGAYFDYDTVTATVNGEPVDVTDESVYTVDPDTNKYTIQGNAIKGVIEMSISKTATKAGVTVTGSGASAAAGYNVSATIGKDYTLTIVPESGWTYVVTATMNGELV